jgi:hypothetical protein
VDREEEADVEMFHVSQLEHLPVKPETIRRETRRDYLLSYDTSGWSLNGESQEIVPYLPFIRTVYFEGSGVVIPPSLGS